MARFTASDEAALVGRLLKHMPDLEGPDEWIVRTVLLDYARVMGAIVLRRLGSGYSSWKFSDRAQITEESVAKYIEYILSELGVTVD